MPERRDDAVQREAADRIELVAQIRGPLRTAIVPRNWWLASIPVVASLPLGMAATGASAPLLVWLGAGLGVGCAWLAHRIAWIERSNRETGFGIAALAWFAIAGPLLIQGLILAYWSTVSGLDWRLAVGGIATQCLVAVAIANGRLKQQFVAQFAGWLPPLLFNFGPMLLISMLIALATAAYIIRFQAGLERQLQARNVRREREHSRAEEILRGYEETGHGWFWETDRCGQITYLSAPVIAVLGCTEAEIIGRPLIELFDLREDGQSSQRTLSFHLSAQSSFVKLAVRAATAEEERWWSLSGRPSYDAFNNFTGFRGSGTDLTEERRSQEKVTRLAKYDSLTGLANRFQMQQSLEKFLASPHDRQRECSVLLIDLDRFKRVNDTLGHPAGDALLKQVAQRLLQTIGDEGQVGRLGGDEFKVIIPGSTARDRLAQISHEVIHSLSQPYSIDGQRVVISASLGIAISPEDGVSGETLIRNADLALYAAKDAGRGRFHFFAHNLHSAAEERNELEQALRDAIARGEFNLAYQPSVGVETGVINGFEALLRWHHPRKGWMSPTKFIPIAEEAGLIAAIGEWALRTACADLATWPEHVRCAVNVSALQFANPQFPAIVTNAIARAGIAPHRLELEITESVFLDDDANTEAMFTALKRIGVRLALDDFGTGYSSLGYLKKAPFDKIKIDRSFVRGATEPGSRNGAIISSITGLATDLGMDTTAEGVETLDELALMHRLGCSHVQGYIFASPLSFEAATDLLAEGGRIEPLGRRSARAPRQKLERMVTLENEGEVYHAFIRNISPEGALVEGLWNVPAGTCFRIVLDENLSVEASTVWCAGEQMGVKFASPVPMDSVLSGASVAPCAVGIDDEMGRCTA